MLSSALMDWFVGLNHGIQFWVLIGAAGVLISVCAIIAQAWRRIRVSEHRTLLATRMLERGMSAEAIAKVLRAAQLGSAEDEEEAGEDRASSGDPEVRIVRALADNDYEGDDVRRVVAAVRSGAGIDPTAATIVESLAAAGMEATHIVEVLEARRAAPRNSDSIAPHAAQVPAGR